MDYQPLGYKLRLESLELDMEFADLDRPAADGITWSIRQRVGGQPSFLVTIPAQILSSFTLGRPLRSEEIKTAMLMAIKDELARQIQANRKPGTRRTDILLQADHPVPVTIEHLRQGLRMAV